MATLGHHMLKNWQFTLILLLFFSLATFAAVWHVSQLQSRLIESSATKNARFFSDALTSFRTLYTSEVVKAAKQHGLEVSHDYAAKENAIPLPATLSMLLGEQLGQHASGSKTRLYSPYPFPWRENSGGLSDQFQAQAWQFLSQNPGKPFYRFSEHDGQRQLRYATADVMRPACVQCHNRHPDSPKTDWQVGDLRGVLEVDLPMGQLIAQTRNDLKGTMAIFGALALLAVIGIAMVTGRLRRTSVELQQRVNERTAELADTSAHLQYLIDNSPAIIYSAVPSGGFDITFVSENLHSVLGYEPREMLDDMNFWLEHIHPDDRSGLMQRLPLLLAEGGQQSHDYRFRHRDGRYLWMHDRLRMLCDDSGKPLELLGSLLDITERKKMEDALHQEKAEQQALIQKLQEARDQLLQNEKMAAIGQLAAGVAHEINNPIGYINSNLGTLQRYTSNLLELIDFYAVMEDALEAGQPALVKQGRALRERIDLDYIKEDLPKLVSESQEGAERVRKIVQDLKEFSHVDEAQWLWADLHQGLESTLNIVHNEVKYKAEIRRAYGKLPKVECLASQINQVFMNLLVNAAHAIEKQGTITLRSGHEGDDVWIEIGDSGQGIPADKLKRIFDPFYTTKPVGVGTGLGLSLSYSIVKKHHGRIEVKSEVGKGTQFTVRLPIKHKKNEP